MRYDCSPVHDTLQSEMRAEMAREAQRELEAMAAEERRQREAEEAEE